ncbi:MAG: hypothetical protein DWI21_15230 [Planctomycetota bacterium]|nr:MAG: hypothetical protein DWI21_15230 [Planctomycetota bacterium]
MIELSFRHRRWTVQKFDAIADDTDVTFPKPPKRLSAPRFGRGAIARRCGCAVLRVILFNQVDHRLDHQQVLSDSVVERTTHPGFDCEAWAVLPSGKVEQME